MAEDRPPKEEPATPASPPLGEIPPKRIYEISREQAEIATIHGRRHAYVPTGELVALLAERDRLLGRVEELSASLLRIREAAWAGLNDRIRPEIERGVALRTIWDEAGRGFDKTHFPDPSHG